MPQEKLVFDVVAREKIKADLKWVFSTLDSQMLQYIQALEEVANASKRVWAIASVGDKPQAHKDAVNRLYDALTVVDWMDSGETLEQEL